jgi:hydrogenase nickel insertion protein HypA
MREEQSTKALFDKVIQQAKAARVKQVQFAIGEISELDQSAIQQHWLALSKGTPLEHAQIHFRLITAEVQCMACFKKYHPVNGIIHCPHCGSFGAKILSGEEFYVEHIETD